MVDKILYAFLYIVAASIEATCFWFGDPIVTLAASVGIMIGAMPAFLALDDRYQRRAAELVEGSTNASKAFFIRELKEMDHDHSLQIERVATKLGGAMTRLEEANAKLHRMIDRPKIGGRFVKRTAIEHEAPKHDRDQ